MSHPNRPGHPQSSSEDRAQSAAQQLAAYRSARAEAAQLAARLEDDLLPSPTAQEAPVPTSFFPSTAQDSASTPAPPPASTPAPAPVPTYSRASVTVSDLRGRNCWICAEGDDDEEEEEDRVAVETGAHGVQTSGRTRRERKWIHPCVCSLIAHESCILKWIRSRRRTHLSRPITCPQCSTPYLIVERRSLALRFFQWWDLAIHLGVPAVSAGFAGGAVLIASTAYGCAAIRAWMGPEAARIVLGGKWPWHYYFDIPLIPFAVVASRLRILDRFVTWLPTLIAFPMTGMPLTAATMSVGAVSTGANFGLFLGQGGLVSRHRRGRAFAEENSLASAGRKWPPSPSLTILLVPWVRALYHLIKRRITRYVLSPFVKKPTPSRSSSATAPSTARATATAAAGGSGGGNHNQSTTSRRRRVIVVGTDSHVEVGGVHDVGVDANGNPRDVPPGAEAISEIRYEAANGAGPDAQGRATATGGAAAGDQDGRGRDTDTLAEDELARIEETAVDDEGRDINERHFSGQETIYVSPHSMARMCIGALSMPFVSSLAGGWLGWVAKRYGWLAKVLGMEIRVNAPGNGSGGKGGVLDWIRASRTSGVTRGGAAQPASSPIARLFSGGGEAGPSTTTTTTDDGSSILFSDQDVGRRDALGMSFGPGTPFDDVDPVWFRNAVGLGILVLFKDALQLAYRFERLRHERMKDRVGVRDRPFGRNMVESPLRLNVEGER